MIVRLLHRDLEFTGSKHGNSLLAHRHGIESGTGVSVRESRNDLCLTSTNPHHHRLIRFCSIYDHLLSGYYLKGIAWVSVFSKMTSIQKLCASQKCMSPFQLLYEGDLLLDMCSEEMLPELFISPFLIFNNSL